MLNFPLTLQQNKLERLSVASFILAKVIFVLWTNALAYSVPA